MAVCAMPGLVLEGKYEIVALVGRGGMANVWLGHDRRLDKMWAIKEVKPSAGGDEARARRQAIIDESNLMKRLDHPFIPRVVDIVDTGAVTFIVMDFVEGLSLARLLREQGHAFEQDRVVAWGVQLCDVIAYLHSRVPPIIYRDLKPSNVMLRDDASLRLVDFGIAMEWRPGATRDARISGTPGYAAPEQLDPLRPTDPRSDIYALGTTLYSLVTGHVPRGTATGAGVRVDFAMRPIRAWDPRLSDGLERVISRATQADPDRRYQAVKELRYDLAHYERLGSDYRGAQRRKIAAFRRQVASSVATAALGSCCLLGSATLRASTYDAYVQRASIMSSEAADDEASPAEEAYGAAIATDPAQSLAYRGLIDTYKADLSFTPAEASRWTELFSRWGRDVASSDAYARLCFDVGVLYLCYYDARGEGGVPSGSAALANARRSAEWFARALEAGEAGALDGAQRRAAATYLTIAEFYDKVSQATYEGVGGADVYRGFWDALVARVDALGPADEAVVRLRLYQIAFQAIASPAYLGGFWRAGVGEAEVVALLERVRDATQALSSDVAQSELVLGPPFQEIVGGADEATENIRTVYGNPAARAQERLDGKGVL